MQAHRINDFSAGWVPSDDALIGRRNGLLRLESAELAQNGAIVMSGGTLRINTVALGSAAHTIFSKYIGTTINYYAALVSGDVIGMSSNDGIVAALASGGSTTRAAFGSLFDSIIYFSGSVRKRNNGVAEKTLGRVAPASAPTAAVGAAGNLTGDYEYAQINVMANGQWIGKSGRSPISSVVSPNAQNVTVTGIDPTAADADANESWIFRRGGDLDEFYRIKRLTSAYTTPFTDSMTDADAITLNIRLNEYLTTVATGGISEDVVQVVGPIYGRMLYFTKSTIYFTDINSPDTYDSRTPIGITKDAGTEQFLFAIKGPENTVFVGTSKDIYILTGSFIQMPDGFLDVALFPLSLGTPPLSIDAVRHDAGIIYTSKLGPTYTDSTGVIAPLAGLNTDRLYRGYTQHGYAPAAVALGNNYAMAISNNKLFMRVPTSGSTRVEVYDLLRKTWSVLPFTTISKLWANENNTLLGFDTNDNFLKIMDYAGAKTLHNSASPSSQSFVVQTPFHDGGAPYSLKTPYALKFRGNPGGNTVIEYAKDNATSFTSLVTLSGSAAGIYITDLSSLGDLSNIQFKLNGTAADWTMQELELLWDQHPEPTPFLHFDFIDTGLLTSHKKKVATLAFVINTFGQNVTFTPVVEGVAGTPSTINTSYRAVVFHQFTAPAFGVRFSGTLQATATYGFEFYGPLQPEVLQVLPIGVRAFQMGPLELFRYGKVAEIQIRMIATTTAVVYTFYSEDVAQKSDSITTVANKDQVYSIPMPKTIGAEVSRIELTSAAIFHVLDARLKAARSGRDTDLEWIPLMNK